MTKFYTATIILALTAFGTFGIVITAIKNQNNFWTEAAQSSMTEVILGNLALQNSQNEEIRTFAQKMVTDHTAVNDELKTLAASKNVMLPTDISAKQKSSMDKLSNLSGMEFDREFMKIMVKDHEALVKLFQKQADSGTDEDAKAFAAKNLPTLQEHLSMARTLSDDMKNMNSNRNSNRNNNSNLNMNSNNNSDMNMNSNDNSNGNMNFNNNTNSTRNRNNNTNSNINMNSNVNNM